MKFRPVTVEELPVGRTGDTVTPAMLQEFLSSEDPSGSGPLAGAEITPDAGEKVDNTRSRLIAAIEKNRFPIRVTSQTVNGVTSLFIKRDESVVAEIDERVNARKAAAEKAKAERKAQREAAKANGGEVAEAPVEAEVTPEPEVEVEAESAPRGRRGR
jgi:hypothetical protein